MSLFKRLCCLLCLLIGFNLNAIAANEAPIEACMGKPLHIGDICAIAPRYINYCDFSKQIVPMHGGMLDGLYACVIAKIS